MDYQKNTDNRVKNRVSRSILDVNTELEHFAIISYKVPIARIQNLIPKPFKLWTFIENEKEYALVSAVPFKDNDFSFYRILKSLKFLLSLNIIAGDALNLKNLQNKPIVFSQWSFLQGGLVKRSDYKFSNLISYRPFEEGTLFSDMGEKVFIPDPVKDHKPIYFMDLEE